jgi:hypothetical protein
MQLNGYKEVSTCTRTPHCRQIGSYLMVSTFAVIYFAALIPRITSQSLLIILPLLFVVSLIMLSVSTWKTSVIDPVDPVMVAYLGGCRSEVSSILHSCLFC